MSPICISTPCHVLTSHTTTEGKLSEAEAAIEAKKAAKGKLSEAEAAIEAKEATEGKLNEAEAAKEAADAVAEGKPTKVWH